MAHPDRRRVPVHVTEEALRPAVGDPHGTAQPQCEQTRVDLQADVLACTERPADTAEHETHRVDREIETCRDLGAVLVQPLRGDVQLDTAAARIGDGERRFETEERLVLHADLVRALDDDVAGRRGVAAHDALMSDQVAVGVDRWVTAVDRRLRVEERFEHLVVDHDGGERPSTGLGVVGGHRGDRFPDVADDVGREHRLVLADQAVGRLAGNVGGGDHRLHPVDLPGTADVDRADPGVRMRRSQRCPPQTSVGGEVGGELEAPLHLRGAVGPGRRRSDRAVAGAGPRRDRRVDDAHRSVPGPGVTPTGNGDLLHGVDDPSIARTAAHVAGELLTDLGVRRRGRPLEQVVDRHDQPRGAEPALHGARLDEGPLDVGGRTDRRHAFDRDDRLTDRARRHHETRTHQHPVEQHAARPTLALLTGALGAHQPETIPQHVEQALAQPRVGHLPAITVDVEDVVVAVARPGAHAANSLLDARRTNRRARTPTAWRRYSAVER